MSEVVLTEELDQAIEAMFHTSEAPFVAADPKQLALSHRREAPPNVRQIRPQVSREIGELVRRMLAKEPLRRPSDEELVRWLAELEIEELRAPT